jgi:PAS domain S-box-containing protein
LNQSRSPLFDQAEAALVYIEPGSDLVTDANVIALDFFGRDPVGVPFSSLFLGLEDGGTIRPLVPTILRPLHSATSSTSHVNVLALPNQDGSLLAIITDTRAPQTTQEQRMRLHVEQTPLAVIEWDLRFEVVAWNPGAEKIFGYTRSEALGCHAAELIVPAEARPHVDRVWEELIQQTGGMRSTNANFAKDGSEIMCEWYNTPLVDDDGHTVGVASLVMDVSAREKSAQLARESESRYEAAQLAAQIANLDSDSETGHLSGAERLIALLGHPDETSPTLDLLLDAMDPDSRQAFEQALVAARDHSAPIALEALVTTPGGEKIWVQVTAEIRPASATAGSRLLGIVQDITSQKLAEEKQQALERQILRSQKLESLGVLAGGIAHDFNNLLVAIFGNLDLLEDRTGEQSELDQESITGVRDAANRAAALTRQLLSFCRNQHVEPEPVELNERLGSLMRLLSRTIPENVSLEFVPGDGHSVVLIEPGQFDQVATNLCINAAQAMPDGGHIALKTDTVMIDDDFTRSHPWARPGRFLLLTVADTGVGMDEETQERVFDPFFSTKGVGVGTGLGLSTVHGIVSKHGGLVHLRSEVGVGTVFEVYLPITMRKPSRMDQPTPPARQQESARILVAEDDDGVRRVTSTILREAGFAVVEASDGLQAIATLRSSAEPFDLAVLDVIMPRSTGFDVFDVIQREAPETRVLFASGYTPQAWPSKDINEVDYAFISKPFDRRELLAKVNLVLAGDDQEQESSL